MLFAFMIMLPGPEHAGEHGQGKGQWKKDEIPLQEHEGDIKEEGQDKDIGPPLAQDPDIRLHLVPDKIQVVVEKLFKGHGLLL